MSILGVNPNITFIVNEMQQFYETANIQNKYNNCFGWNLHNAKRYDYKICNPQKHSLDSYFKVIHIEPWLFFKLW